MPITYMQNGMKHNEEEIRLSLPITLKQMVKEADGFDKTFLFLRHRAFSQVSNIKQLMIFPPQNGKCDVVLNYEVKEAVALPNNGKYLAIDLGIHNLATCFDSANDKTFIVGREYLAICHYFHKEIAKAQSALAKQSSSQWKSPQYTSKRLKALRKKKNNSIRDYLHKLTKFIVNYCIKNEINTVVVGDLKDILDTANKVNQELYTTSSYKGLADAIAEATARLENGTAEEIDASVKALDNALKALVVRAKADEVKEYINSITLVDLSKYTDSSAKIYQEAYNVLKAMLDNLSDISAKEFIEAKNNFETAVAKLEEKATVAPIPTPTPNELPASDSAKTGDDVNIFAYVTGLGVVAIVGIYWLLRKKEE